MQKTIFMQYYVHVELWHFFFFERAKKKLKSKRQVFL